MNAVSCSISTQAIKENIVIPFLAQNKKILIIASLAFAAFTAAFLFLRNIDVVCFIKSVPSKWIIFKSYFYPVNGVVEDHHFSHPLGYGYISLQRERGMFRYGKLEGNGERNYGGSGGPLYSEIGTFHEGQLHGEGVLESRDTGDSEHKKTEGKFEKGVLNGYGKITFKQPNYTDISYDGNFVNGCLTISLPTGIKKIYQSGMIEEGQFIYDELSGSGKRVINNVILEKKWHKDKNNTLGDYTRHFPPRGREKVIEEGTFEKGLLRKGKISNCYFTYEGEFDDMGQLHGEGKITCLKYGTSNITKSTLEGTFKHGKLKRDNQLFYFVS